MFVLWSSGGALPMPPISAATTSSATAGLQVESTPVQLGLHRVIDEVDDAPQLCRAPCRIELPVGPHQLALSLASRDPVLVEGAVMITPSARALELVYEDNQKLRAGGLGLLILAAAGIAGGGALVFNEPLISFLSSPDVDEGRIAAGIAVASLGLVSLATGVVLLLVDDSAHVVVH